MRPSNNPRSGIANRPRRGWFCGSYDGSYYGGLRGIVLGLAMVSSGVLTACSMYDESVLAGRTQNSLTCELKRLPDVPAVGDDGVDVGELWFALLDVEVDQPSGRWAEIGFDLDGLCTPPEDPNAPVRCITRGGRYPAKDGPGGVDNYAGEYALQAAAMQMPYMQPDLRTAERLGVTQALRVRGWNGLDNDPDVRIAIVDAVFALPSEQTFVETPGKAESPLLADWSYGAPRWDGTDKLWISSASLVDRDPNRPIEEYVAYVVNRRFVVRSQARSLTPMNASKFAIAFGFAEEVFSGRISADSMSLEEVTWQGRWTVNNIVEAITSPTFTCMQGPVEYDLLLDSATRMADMRADPATEDQGLECDSLSTAIGFSGARIQLGGVAEPGPLPDPCLYTTE
jgi:hypothetical protein